jgi:hypothetical protein
MLPHAGNYGLKEMHGMEIDQKRHVAVLQCSDQDAPDASPQHSLGLKST